MRPKRRTELLVGIFLLMGIIILSVMVVNLGNFTQGAKDAYQIRVVFRNAAGIVKEGEVRLGGAKIGRVVTTPTLTERGDAVSMMLELEKGVNLRKGTVARAATLNLMGEKFIEMIPPTVETDQVILPGTTIFGDSGDDLETIKTNVATISQQTIDLLDRVGDAMGDMQKAAKGFADLAENLNKGVLSEKNIKNFDIAMENMAITSQNLAKSSEAIPATLENVREVTQNIKDTSDGIQNLVSKVDKKITDLEPAFATVVPTMQNFQKTSEKLDRMTTRIDKSQGILGAMINDSKLKLYIEDFISRIRAQGILRYKNPEAEDEIDLRDRAKMQGRRN